MPRDLVLRNVNVDVKARRGISGRRFRLRGDRRIERYPCTPVHPCGIASAVERFRRRGARDSRFRDGTDRERRFQRSCAGRRQREVRDRFKTTRAAVDEFSFRAETLTLGVVGRVCRDTPDSLRHRLDLRGHRRQRDVVDSDAVVALSNGCFLEAVGFEQLPAIRAGTLRRRHIVEVKERQREVFRLGFHDPDLGITRALTWRPSN